MTTNGASAVTVAAGSNNEDLLTIILEHGGDPDIIDQQSGKTALLISISLI
jgi:hypothetical protein